MQPIHVSIYEDSKHLRESLYYFINGTEGFLCTGAFADCNDLLYQLKRSLPDVFYFPTLILNGQTFKRELVIVR